MSYRYDLGYVLKLVNEKSGDCYAIISIFDRFLIHLTILLYGFILNEFRRSEGNNTHSVYKTCQRTMGLRQS